MQNNVLYKKFIFSSDLKVLKNMDFIIINGPLGVLSLDIPKLLNLHKIDGNLVLSAKFANKSLFFTFISLIKQKIKGVTLGFFEILVINGTGWRVISEKSNQLVFKLGFSHDIVYFVPKNIEVFVIDKQTFKIFSLDLECLHQFISIVCSLKKFDLYKGKGIRKLHCPVVLKLSSKSK